MAELKKKIYSGGAAALLALAVFFLVQALFEPALAGKKAALETGEASLSRLQGMIERRGEYETEWALYQGFFEDAREDDLLNRWTRGLLDYSSAEGLHFMKLEPRGVQKNGKDRELRLYLSFRGGAETLAKFLYHLHENDPLSRLDSVVMRTGDAPGQFFYELVLGKAVK